MLRCLLRGPGGSQGTKVIPVSKVWSSTLQPLVPGTILETLAPQCNI
jgi:hypothetical protein